MNVVDYFLKKTNTFTGARQGLWEYNEAAVKLNRLNDLARAEGLDLECAVEPMEYWTGTRVRKSLNRISMHEPHIRARRESA